MVSYIGVKIAKAIWQADFLWLHKNGLRQPLRRICAFMPNIGQLVLFLIKSAEGSPLERFSMPICHDVHKLSSSKKPSVQVLFWAVTWLEAHLQHMFPDQWRNLFMLPYFRSAVRIKRHCIGYLSQQFHRGRGKGPMLALAARVCYLPMAPRYWLQAHADTSSLGAALGPRPWFPRLGWCVDRRLFNFWAVQPAPSWR